MSRFYLIGLPGSGKSTSGKRFAKKMGLGYADLDKLVQIHAKLRIPEIFELHGEAYFRSLERSCLLQTAESDALVVGCGGGTPAWLNNIEWMREHGTVIWLNIATDELAKRLQKSRNTRPFFPSREITDIRNQLIQLLEKRIKYYEKADFQINSEIALIELADYFLMNKC
jgi:shikimate kinase